MESSLPNRMSSSANTLDHCPFCSGELTPGSFECPKCHAPVHGARAGPTEDGAQLGPANSQNPRSAGGYSNAFQNEKPPTKVPKKENKWAKRLGPLGPVAVLLAKAKAIFLAVLKLKFLLSFVAFIGVYWALWGPKFGVGFALLILIHELGHFIEVKRRGLPAEMPVFLPGIGAYVKWQAMGVSLEARAGVSLAGPLAGWIASAFCIVIWFKTGDPVWGALARAGAWLNVLNLIPIWVLDGGSAALALDRSGRFLLVAIGLALGLILHEVLFFVLSAVAIYRLFTKDMPPEPSRIITAYYAILLVALGGILQLVPGQGIISR